jgi:hypothetical protein
MFTVVVVNAVVKMFLAAVRTRPASPSPIFRTRRFYGFKDEGLEKLGRAGQKLGLVARDRSEGKISAGLRRDLAHSEQLPHP